MTLKSIVNLFQNNQVIEVYVLDNDGEFMKSPIYMNRKEYLLDVLISIFGINYVCNMDIENDITLDTGSIGYDSSHAILMIQSTIMKYDNYESMDKDWWTNLAPIGNDEIKEIFHHCINDYMITLIKQSSNELAVKSLQSGKLDEAVDKILESMDVVSILMLGITRLDMKNLYNNPGGSDLYKSIVFNIESVVKGDGGKDLMAMLFG